MQANARTFAPAVGRMSPQEAVDITIFLGQRFGDGLVYLHGSQDRVLLGSAISLGLVDEDGYLTPAGHRFWQIRQN